VLTYPVSTIEQAFFQQGQNADILQVYVDIEVSVLSLVVSRLFCSPVSVADEHGGQDCHASHGTSFPLLHPLWVAQRTCNQFNLSQSKHGSQSEFALTRVFGKLAVVAWFEILYQNLSRAKERPREKSQGGQSSTQDLILGPLEYESSWNRLIFYKQPFQISASLMATTLFVVFLRIVLEL
jgi:hypothetical protein